jgi:hypothetical protein
VTDPSAELLHRFAVLQASPSWLQMSWEDKEAFEGRLQSVYATGDLSSEDQELLRNGALEVAAGKSPTLTDPQEWGDWAAIDAAVDADNDTALDAALLTVGRGFEVGMPILEPDPADVDTEDLPDDNDWVGVGE